jgi:hypothetical protein
MFRLRICAGQSELIAPRPARVVLRSSLVAGLTPFIILYIFISKVTVRKYDCEEVFFHSMRSG